MEIEVLFKYFKYRCSYYLYRKKKLCREIEHHLQKVGSLADPEVVVLSFTGSTARIQWNSDWKCFINIDSLENVGANDRLIVARTHPEADVEGS